MDLGPAPLASGLPPLPLAGTAACASGDPCRWPVTDASKPSFQVIGVGVVLMRRERC